MEIIVGWILLGIVNCWILRHDNETKGDQLLTIMFAPISAIFSVIEILDILGIWLSGPAIGRKK
jgi:hypothetical protein